MKLRAVKFLCLALLGSAHAAAPPTSRAPTIGDLNSQSVPVQRDSKLASGSASKAMENYRQFLQLQNADPRLRAEALRRLGDLNLEGGELERMATEVTQVDAQGAEAIRLYMTLLKAYPNYPRNDQVLYQLARAYETTGQSELALNSLNIIVARYPQSHDLGEVQFRRGELLFSDRRYADAQLAYEAVLARGRDGSTFYVQSLYKDGWSLFKQGQNEPSLKPFGDLLQLMLLDPKDPSQPRRLESLGRADRELLDDTLRVMSITFSYLDGAKSVDEYVSQHPTIPYAYLLYVRLGDLLVEKQRYQDAASTYRAFVSRDPVDEHAPMLTNAAIEAYRKGGFADLLLDGKLEYVQRYGFDSPFWNNRQRSAYPQVVADLKTNLKDVAEYYHAAAQKSKKSDDYIAAAHWYRVFLSSFPGDPDSAATNYLLAEALFESRQYPDAATEYEHTAYGYPVNARSAEAGYAALVAYQKEEDGLTPEARAPVHQRATASAVKFAKEFPDHPQSAVVLTRAAQDLYTQGDQAGAADIARILLARTPPVDAAKQRIGWTLVGQVSFNQGDFPAAEDAFSHAVSVAAANDPERADISERLADSVYKQGEAKRTAGDQSGAADDFLRVARVAPTSKAVGTAQYDAAAALINAQQWDQAIAVLEAYRRDYPKSEYAADVDRKLAVAYVAAGRSGAAAAQFERIASNPKEDPAVVREALTKAADLYQQSGDTARAVPLLERLIKNYPTPVADAIETRQRLLEIAAKNGDGQRQQYWEREIIAADAAAGAGRTDRTKFLAAKAQLALAQPSRDAFRSIKLVAPLKQSLAAKKKALEAAVQAYKEAAAYSVAEATTAATYETAELYRTLAQDLMQSERPKKLSADELEQYDSLLEEQAFPFEEQSITIHELNTKRAQEGTYDDSVRASFAALAQLKPARYGKSELSAEVVTPAIESGLLARKEGKLTDSEDDLRRATGLDAVDAVAWDELGITLREEGKFADARSAYERAIAADDGYAPAHRNLGVLLDLYVGDPEAALPQFERYKELTSEDKPVSTWIAELRVRTGIKAPAPPAAAPAEAPAEAPVSATAPDSGAAGTTAASNQGGPT
jgi:cellulose synthase operon protein C